MSTMINTNSVVSAGGPSKGLTKLNEIDMADDSCKKLYAKGYSREEVIQTLQEAFTLLSDVDIERTVKSVFDAPKEAPVNRKKSPSRQKSVSRQKEASSGEDESEEEAPVSRQKKTSSRKAVVEEEEAPAPASRKAAFALVEDKLPGALAIMKAKRDDAQAVGAMLSVAFQENKPNKQTGIVKACIKNWKAGLEKTSKKRAASPKAFYGVVGMLTPLVQEYCDRPGLKHAPEFEDSMDRWIHYAKSVDPETFATYLSGKTTHTYSDDALAAAYDKVTPAEARIKVNSNTDHATCVAYAAWYFVRTIFDLEV